MSIDKRVVDMQFNNKQFEQGIEETTTSLDKLKASLRLDGIATGIKNVETAVTGWDMSGMADGVAAVEGRFSTMGIVGMEVIRRVTNGAIDMGKKLSAAISGPIVDGGKKRAINIEQAKFQFRGLDMDVEKAMEDALYAVKGTAYGLDEAAIAASTLGASGVQLGDDMKRSLRGISGLSAMTNSDYGDMARIFGTVAGQGKMMTMQLRQIEGRGVNAAAVMAKAWGKTESEVRGMITDGQVDFEMFSSVMDDTFGEHATKANETFTGSLANVRAALARVGAMFFTPALQHFTDLFNAIMPAVDAAAAALQPFIVSMAEVVGIMTNKLGDAIKSLDFADLTKGTESSNKGFASFVRTLRGVAAVAEIVWMFVKALGTAFMDTVRYILPVGEGLLGVTGSIGDLVVKLKDAIKEADIFNKAFGFIGDVLRPVTDIVKAFAGAIFGAFDGLNNSDVETFPNKVERFYTPLGVLGDIIGGAFTALKNMLAGFGPIFKIISDGGKQAFNDVVQAMSSSFKEASFDPLMDVINAGIFGVILYRIKQFLFQGERLIGKTNILTQIQFIFIGLERTLKSFQAGLNAQTLMRLAGALAILTVSVIALSMVDSDRLAASLAAMGVAFGQLLLAMGVFSKISDTAKVGKMTVLSGALILLSIAMNILANAVVKLSKIPWKDMVKGLAGTGAMLVILSKTVGNMKGISVTKGLGILILAGALHVLAGAVEKFGAMSAGEAIKGLAVVGVLLAQIAIFSKATGNAGSLLVTSIALTILGSALKKFGAVLEQLGGLSIKEIAKGLLGMSAALVLIAASMRLMPKGMLVTAGALLIVASAVKSLAVSMTHIGELDLATIGKGIGGIAAMLGIIIVAMMGMQSALPGAAALVVVAMALATLVPILKIFGSMSLGSIGKGLLALGGIFAVIGIASLLLAPVTPIILGLSAAIGLLGAAIFLMGTGVGAFAAGMTALSISSAVNAASTAASIKIFLDLIPYTLKKIAEGFAQMIITIIDNAEAVLAASVGMLGAIVEAIVEFLKIVADKIPDIVKVAADIIVAFADALTKEIPRLIESGVQLMLALINGIANSLRDNEEELRKAGINMMTAVLSAATGMLGDILKLGKELVGEVISGIKAKGTDLYNSAKESVQNVITGAKSILTDMGQIGKDMINGLIGGIGSMGTALYESAKGAVSSAVDGVKKFLGINSPSRVFAEIGGYSGEGFIVGMNAKAKAVTKSATDVGDNALQAMKAAMVKAYDVMSEDPGLNPTIKPVVDMTNVDASLNAMDRGFNSTRALNLASAHQAASMVSASTKGMDIPTEGNTNTSSVVNFVQNNHSPKALSRIDIYRQTQNQVKMLKGLV